MRTILLYFCNHAAANMTLENLLTGEPSLDDIPMERNLVNGAGDGVVMLKNPAYSLPTGLQPMLVSQPLPVAPDREGQLKNDEPVTVD